MSNAVLNMDQQLELAKRRRMERAQQAQAQLQTQLEQNVIKTPTKQDITDNLGFTQARIHNVSTEYATNVANNIQNNVNANIQNVPNYVGNVQARVGNYTSNVENSIDSQMESGLRQAEQTKRRAHRTLARKKTYAEKIGQGLVKAGDDLGKGVANVGKNVTRQVEKVGNNAKNMLTDAMDEVDEMLDDNVPGYNAVAGMFRSNKVAPEFDVEELLDNNDSGNLELMRRSSVHNANAFHYDGEADDTRTEEERLKDIHDKIARDLLKELKEMGKIFTLCGDYYARINHLLTLPTIIITAMSGFVSFLGGSTGIPESWRQWFAVVVGFMATLATILGGFQSTFKWGSKSDQFLNAAQQLLILEGKLNFCILSDDDSLKDIQVIQETMQDIAKGMRFFPPTELVKKWWEMGMIDESQKREPLPSWAAKHLRDLRDLGINEKNDLRFITHEMLEKIDPPMSKKTIKKVYLEKAKQGGIMTEEATRYLSKRTIRKLKADGLWKDGESHNGRKSKR